MNLWDELMGDGGAPPPAPTGSAILCGCGRRIGVETTEGDVWAAGYHHTAAGAATVVFQILLEDYSALVDLEQRGELWAESRAIAETVVGFARLANPATDGDLSPLARVLPRLVVPAQTFRRAALDLGSPIGLRARFAASVPAGCKKCRLIYDVREIVGTGARNKRGALLVGSCLPAKVDRIDYPAPESRLRERVALYARLNAVLLS